jgi:nucleoside-diphosphate kinase
MIQEERTLVLLKPDCIQRGLVGEIIHRFEQKGLKILGLKMISPSRRLFEEFYSIHKGKPFYEELIEFMITGPVVVFVLYGPESIKVARNMVGATDFVQAQPGTLRGDYSLSVRKNLVHASDSAESAAKEIRLLFDEKELKDWKSHISEYIR